MENIFSPEILTALLFAAFLVGLINAMFGVGGSLLAYPLLLYWLPGKIIIGVLSIIVIVATLHRILLYRKELNVTAVLYFLLLGIPSSVAGAYALARISVGALQVAVGIFLIGTTLAQWLTERRGHGIAEPGPRPGKYFIGVGAISGFLTGLLGSAGFINTIFLLRAGFVKEGISVNQAGIALAYSLIKLPVYWNYGILTPSVFVAGLLGSAGSVAGTFLGSYFLRRMTVRRFTLLLRLLILFAGVNLLFR